MWIVDSMLEVPVAQFVDPPPEAYVRRLDGPKRWSRVIMLAMAIGAGVAAWRWSTAPSSFDGLLTMQSILVGLVGAMALHLWGEGLQARRDDRRYQGAVLAALDRMRKDLTYGLALGVTAAGATTGALFMGPADAVPTWVLGVIAGTSVYTLLLFAGAMTSMGRLYQDLR